MKNYYYRSMKNAKLKPTILLFIAVISSIQLLSGQTTEDGFAKAKKMSFLDQIQMEEIQELKLSMNVQTVYDDWKYQNYHWGFVNMALGDKGVFSEEIKVKTRGKFRSKFCDNPPIKIKFKKKDLKAYELKKMNEFKVVYPCKNSSRYETYVLKEYLIYKLYNKLTDNSLRVHLVDLMIEDSAAIVSPKQFKGFLIEHSEEFIDRFDAVEIDKDCPTYTSADMNPHHQILFEVFQFFIGNTDWVLPTCKNAELVKMKDGTIIPIPYDFDFCGMVNAEYAVADSNYGVNDVRDRVYKGGNRPLNEFTPIFDLYREKKTELIQTVERFELLSNKEKKKMVKYIHSFYEIIDNPKKVDEYFSASE